MLLVIRIKENNRRSRRTLVLQTPEHENGATQQLNATRANRSALRQPQRSRGRAGRTGGTGGTEDHLQTRIKDSLQARRRWSSGGWWRLFSRSAHIAFQRKDAKASWVGRAHLDAGPIQRDYAGFHASVCKRVSNHTRKSLDYPSGRYEVIITALMMMRE